MTEQGDAARGAALARIAIRLHERLGDAAAANKDRNDLGLALTAAGSPDEALAVYADTLKAARDEGDAQAEATALSNIAGVRLSFGDLDEAVAGYKQASDAAKKSGDADAEATAAADLGMAYHAQGDEAAALAQIDAAIALRQASHDRRGEAIDRNDRALVQSDAGDPQAALDAYAQTRAVFAALGDDENEAVTLNNIGSVYRALGARPEARRYYEQARAIHERTHDDAGLAVVLNNIAVAAQGGDEPDDALLAYTRALAIQTRLGDRLAQARLSDGMAMAHEAQGDHAAALPLLSRALELSRAAGSLADQALALHNRATVHEATGDDAQALQDLQDALPLWRRTGAAQGEAASRFVIARIEAAQGRTQDALADAEASIALDESQRGRIASEDLRASFLAGAGAAYDLRTELLMRLDAQQPGHGYAAQALEATEAARARSLLDQLTEAAPRRADKSQAQRQTAIRRALSAKDAQRRKLGLDTPEGARLTREIDDLLAEQDRLEAAIRAADPAWAAIAAPEPMGLARIQALLDPDTVLLDYKLGAGRGFLWVVSGASLRTYELPPRRTVLSAANALRAAVDAPGDRGFDAASAALGAMLLGPAGPQIEGRRLVIVADAALQSRIPFAALTTAGRLVVETHEVVSEPSVAALDAVRRAAAGRARPAGAVAVFADPVVSPDDPRLPRGLPAPDVLRVAAAETSLPRLPATRSEADAILALAPPDARLARFGFDATREAAEDPALAGYRIVHFATHGLTDARTPALSGLVFSLFGPDGAPRDGFLRLGDVSALSLPVDLVVLSACETGLGREEGGEGLVGISRGFLYAGASRLVATLWTVEDRSTADLMARFYEAMLGPQALPPAAAMRSAQLATMAADPRRWAGFTLQGEWR